MGPSPRHQAAAWGVVALISLLAAATATAQPPDVLAHAPGVSLSARRVTSELRERRAVRVNFATLDAVRTAGRGVVRMAFFHDATFDLVLDRVHERSPKSYTLTGRLASNPFADAIVSVEENVAVADVKIPARAAYELRYAGGGIHEARRVDHDAMAPCGVNSETAPLLTVPPAATVRTPTTAADTATTMDVMVCYTPAAATLAGGTTAIIAEIHSAIASANLAYANSLVTQRLSLVHTHEVSYTESGSMVTDASRLQASADGFMDEVHALRDLYRADFVHLLTDHPGTGTCGIAYTLTSASPDYAFGVTDVACLGAETLAHELAHNMGCVHDRDNAPVPGRDSYSYGHRWVSTDTFTYRSVMAYAPGTRVKHFSNPDVEYIGTATGVPIGDPLEAHCAATLNNSASDGANYRQQNDSFANRILLPAGDIEYNGRNAGHTKESGEPDHAGSTGGASSWWSWSASAYGTATVSTDGSAFDTLLGVYTGSAVGSLTPVASNDDISGGNTRSRVEFTMLPGTAYQIAVDGKDGAFGEITLTIDTDSSGPATIAQAPAALAPATTKGFRAASQTITVANSGDGALDYTIAASEPWLTATPATGFTISTAQPHTIVYDTAALAEGTHPATITITDPFATNSPQTISVLLTVKPPVPGDNRVTIESPEQGAAGRFGAAVALQGSVVAAGAPDAPPAGRAHSFRILKKAPHVSPEIAATSPGATAFGHRVEFGGSTLYVSAPDTNALSPGAGAAVALSGKKKTLGTLLTLYTAAGLNDGAHLGNGLRVIGSSLLLGAPRADTASVPGAGKAVVLSAKSGALIAEIESPEPAAGADFGASVSNAGSKLVIGAPGDGETTGAGRVYVFARKGKTYVHDFTISNPEPEEDAAFGRSVAGLGRRIIVGAPGAAAGAGKAYLFRSKADKTGAPVQDATISNPAPVAGGRFGESVAFLSGKVAAIGAPGNTAGGEAAAGAVYFRNTTDGSPFAPRPTFENPDPADGGEVGSAVTGKGARAVIGEPGRHADDGTVHVISLK